MSGADATNGYLALAGTEIGDGQAGDIAGQLRQIAGAGIANLLLRRRGDGEGYILQRGRALLRSNDDLFYFIGYLGRSRGKREHGNETSDEGSDVIHYVSPRSPFFAVAQIGACERTTDAVGNGSPTRVYILLSP